MEDSLTIGYDNGEERGDTPCIQILRKKGRGYQVVNTFYGKEAVELYKRLIKHN